jgi:acyl-CoA reductase-like NAD-dependent aldehyde dehydrogenase
LLGFVQGSLRRTHLTHVTCTILSALDCYSRGREGGRTLSVYNPKDATLVSDQVTLAIEHDVDAAVSPAEVAFHLWKIASAPRRRNILFKFAELLEKSIEPLAEFSRISLGATFALFD